MRPEGGKGMETKMISFYGDKLNAVKKNASVFVSAKQVAEHLGLDWSTQLRKLRDDEVISEGMVMMTIPEISSQESVLIRADLLPLWVTTISTNKVKSELREKVTRYRREAAKVLADAFLPQFKATGNFRIAQIQALINQELADQREQIEMHESRIAEVEVKQLGSGDTGYCSALGYLKMNGLCTEDKVVNRFGIRCSKVAKELGIVIGKLPDARYGRVNSYPISILDQISEDFFKEAVA